MMFYDSLGMIFLIDILTEFRLSTRKEKEIAVVTHSGFLYQTLNSFGNDCDPSVKNEISKK